jgi:transglutaminase-like putative cysteine protease
MHVQALSDYSRLGVDSLTVQPLAQDKAGTVQTLAAMADLVRKGAADPAIRDEALAICQNVQGHDFKGEIEALFHFCQHHIRYRRDPVEQERVQDARRTVFVFRSGDCDDKCVALGSLLGSLGHKTRFVVIGKRPDSYTHVYLHVLDKKRGWLPLDPTPEQSPPGWEAKGYYSSTYEIFGEDDGLCPSQLLGLGLIAVSVFALLRGTHGR